MIVMNHEAKGYAKIFLAGCLWGTIGIFVKMMERNGCGATYTSFIRLFFAFLLLALLTLFLDGAKAFLIGKHTLLSCALFGVVCHGLDNILYSLSISYNGVTVASGLVYTAPVFTGALSFLFFRERLPIYRWAALLLNALGCVLTATGGVMRGDSIIPLGILIGIGSGLTYAMTAIFGRIAMQENASPFAVAMYNAFFGCAFVAVVSRPWTSVAAPLDGQLLLIGLFYAMIPTVAAYLLYFSGISHIKQTGKVPVVASVELIVAALIGVFVFREAISAGNIVGIVLVLLSIFLFSK